MSMLRNCPVVCGSKRIGLLQSISLNSAQNQVRALIVASGMRGKRVVPASGILSISSGFILADRVEKYERSDEAVQMGFVRDTTGLLLGRVTDYAIDTKTLQIAAIEMIRGYLPAESSARIWVFSFAASDKRAGELIAETYLTCESTDQKEEMETCGFQP